MNPVERLSRFVDDLLRDRRPRRYPTDEDEAAAMLAAAALKASRPGADLPRPEFIAELERKLAGEMAGNATATPSWSRRRILQVGGAVAAALVAGVGVDRAIERIDVTPSAQPSSAELALKNGRWVAVMSAAAVAPEHAVRFSAGAVEGFVINRGGKLQALSAVCTHMGCIVRFNATRGSLDCPCHGASFALDGSPINHDYLQSLPRLASRISGDMVEVMVNKEA